MWERTWARQSEAFKLEARMTGLLLTRRSDFSHIAVHVSQAESILRFAEANIPGYITGNSSDSS